MDVQQTTPLQEIKSKIQQMIQDGEIQITCQEPAHNSIEILIANAMKTDEEADKIQTPIEKISATIRQMRSDGEIELDIQHPPENQLNILFNNQLAPVQSEDRKRLVTKTVLNW